jgi:hypothetical protein
MRINLPQLTPECAENHGHHTTVLANAAKKAPAVLLPETRHSFTESPSFYLVEIGTPGTIPILGHVNVA